jgi:hypothetical protein
MPVSTSNGQTKVDIDRFVAVSSAFQPHNSAPEEAPPLPTIRAEIKSPTPAPESRDSKTWPSSGPFSQHVASIVDSLRSSRTLLSCSLENSQARANALTAELDGVNAQRALDLAALQQIDDTLAACQLVVDNSSKIAPQWLKPSTAKHTSRVAYSNGATFTYADARKVFHSHPGQSFTAKEIADAASPEKQASARTSLPPALSYLRAKGEIVRIGRGTYQLASPKE